MQDPAVVMTEKETQGDEAQVTPATTVSDAAAGVIEPKIKPPPPPQAEEQPFSGDWQEDEEEDDVDNSALPLLTEWANTTSVHGMPYVFDTTHYQHWRRAMWIGIVALSFSILLWQILWLISDYTEHTNTFSTATESPTSMIFPDITVCNNNPFLYSRLSLTTGYPTTDEELFNMSQPLEGFIYFTHFIFKPYNDSSAVWDPVVVDDFGVCWRFNRNDQISSTGRGFGLSFFLDIHLDEYQVETELAGIRLYVTQPKTPLSTQLPYLVLGAGKTHVVYFEETVFERERKSPWSKCHSEAPTYTLDSCNCKCYNKFVRETCDCAIIGDTERQGLEYCVSTCCKYNVTLDGLACEECSLPPCHEIKYKSRLSSIDPTDIREELDAEEYLTAQGVNVTDDSLASAKEYFNFNVMKVELNFDSIQRTIITETRHVLIFETNWQNQPGCFFPHRLWA